MMSTNNILHPANGQPIIVPSQDIVLGLYYLSMMNENEPGEGMLFADMGEIDHALAAGAVTLHTKIKQPLSSADGRGGQRVPRRSSRPRPGRMLLGELLPKNANDALRRRQPADDQEGDLRT